MVVGAIALVWCYVWTEAQPPLAFQLALVTPSIVLENIMICCVFRNTKLGLYDTGCTVPIQSSNPNLQMDVESTDMTSWNSGHNATDAHSNAVAPT